MSGKGEVDYGYGDAQPDYGYGEAQPDYGYGEAQPDYGYGEAQPDYGYGEAQPDYGYGDAQPDQDYGYGEPESAKKKQSESDSKDPYGYETKDNGSSPPTEPNGGGRRHRSVRRNSCIIRKDQDPLAVAEFLMGPPPMSDRDMEAKQQSQQVTA